MWRKEAYEVVNSDMNRTRDWRMCAYSKLLKHNLWFAYAFSGTMVLLDDAIQVLILPTLIGMGRSTLSASSAARLAPLFSTVTVSG